MDTQYNEIARKFGMALLNSSIKMFQLAFKDLKPEVKAFGFIKDCFINVGLKDIPVTQLDANYYLTDWENWQLVTDLVIMEKLPYYADLFDCDNYGFLFASLSGLLLRLNSAGVGYGTVYNAKGDKIALHYFNIIATKDGKLYCFEPMNGNYCLIEKGKPIVMAHGWRYEIISARFF